MSSLSPIFFNCLDFSSRNVVRFPTLNRLIEFEFSVKKVIHVLTKCKFILRRYSQRLFCVNVALICSYMIPLSTPSTPSSFLAYKKTHRVFRQLHFSRELLSIGLRKYKLKLFALLLFDLSFIRAFLVYFIASDCLHT